MRALMTNEAGNGNESIKSGIRQRIAELRQSINDGRKNLAELSRQLDEAERALAVFEGREHESQRAGIFRGVGSIDAMIVYLNMAGGPVREEQLVRDLVKEGAGLGKAAKKGGPEWVTRMSIKTFLKHGKKSNPEPLLIREGRPDDPERTIRLSPTFDKHIPKKQSPRKPKLPPTPEGNQ